MTLVLRRSDLAGLVDRAAVLEVVRHGLARHGEPTGTSTDSALPGTLATPGDDALLVPLVGVDGESGLATAKLLVDRPSSLAEGRPSQTSVVVLTDPRTGRAEAILHGAVPTRLRTAAVTAVATDVLASPDADVLGLVGAGALAVEHALAIAQVRRLRRIHVWSRTLRTVDRFRADLGREWPQAVEVVAEPDPESVVRAADIVTTLTPSEQPVVSGAWLRPGQHLSLVGARPRHDQREGDALALHAGPLVVDHRASVEAHSGDYRLAHHPADGRLPRIRGEIGEVLRGAVPGRRTPEEITVFDSVGAGAQDTAVCALLVQVAREKGVGVEVELDG